MPPFARNFRALLARFGEADGNRLFATLYCSSLAASAGFKSAALFSAHRAFDGFACGLAVLSSTRLFAGTLLGRHEVSSP